MNWYECFCHKFDMTDQIFMHILLTFKSLINEFMSAEMFELCTKVRESSHLEFFKALTS